ncbi:MAG: hypothetical protein KJ709_05905 [Nanoarchaeota archaeon]|nr:hypothetical protein [Nanoarchaeota archaeon]
MRKPVLFLLILLLALPVMALDPAPPMGMDILYNQSPTQQVGGMLNTTRGTINFVNLNATTQSFRWLGFIGNITGTLALMDANNNSIYQWGIDELRGEIYATRYSGTISWGAISCADASNIEDEQDYLTINMSDADSINKTFNITSHRSFYVGDTSISGDSCPSTALFQNNAYQTDYFQEILLHDSTYMVYAGLINGSQTSYEGSTADFQMVMPARGQEGPAQNVPYYFYVELR